MNFTQEMLSSKNTAMDATVSFNPAMDATVSFNQAMDATISSNPAPDATVSFRPAIDATVSFNSTLDATVSFNPTYDNTVSFNPAYDNTVSFNPAYDATVSFNPAMDATVNFLSTMIDTFSNGSENWTDALRSPNTSSADGIVEVSDATDTRDRLIPDEVMLYVTIYLSIVIPILISAFGMATNVINMVVFYKLGLKDGMTVGLWALSFSDLLVTFQTLGSSLCYLANLVFPHAPVNPILVQYVSLCWTQDMMYLVSNWITTFISIERSVSVISPFRVRSIFTRTRSIWAMVIIYGFHIGSYVPIFVSHRLVWLPAGVNPNSTESEQTYTMAVTYSVNRAEIHHAVDILNGAVLPVIQQALVIGSAVCLVYGLKASSRVRKTEMCLKVGAKKQSALSAKESRLVTVVVALALILTVCNIPRFIAVYATLLVPEMYIGRVYENVYVFLWALTALFASLNASVNICVYMMVNLSFRSTFVGMICPSISSRTMDTDSSRTPSVKRIS